MAAIANVKVIESMIEVPAAASVQYRKVDREAKVGDVIRYNDERSYVTRGGFYEVVRVDNAGDPQIIDNDGDEYDLCGDDYEVYEKVTEPPKQARIPVGSYVRVTDNEQRGWASIAAGSIGKITDDDGKDFVPYQVTSLSDRSNYGWYDANELTLLSEAEAKAAVEAKAEHQRLEAERAKWAAIGRKVNEYKNGDVVRGKRKLGKQEYVVGEIEDTPAQQVTGFNAGIVTFEGIYRVLYADTLELLVPVEQRFDRTEAVS